MGGILGKFIGGAAEAALPAMQEDHKAKILAERDARLRAYDIDDQKTAREFATTERKAGEAFQSGQADIERGIQKDRYAVEDARADRSDALQERTFALDESRTAAAIAASQAQLQGANLDNAAKQEVQDALDAWQAAPPEEKDQAYIDYLKTSNQFATKDGKSTTSIQKITNTDAMGNETEELVIVDTATGKGTVVTYDPNYPAPDAGAIEMLDDDPANRAEFDEIYGPGMADKLKPLKGADAPDAPETPEAAGAEAAPAAPRSLIAGAVAEGGQQYAAPEGGDYVMGDKNVDDFVNKVGGFLSNAPARQKAALDKSASRTAASSPDQIVAGYMSRGVLPPKASPGDIQIIERAIASGKLSEEQVKALEDYLQEAE